MQRNTSIKNKKTLTIMSEAADIEARAMPSAAIAGLAYFSIVFAVGFALGTLRVLVLIPTFGDPIAAIIVELPIILALSWMASRWLIVRFDVPISFNARLVMGGLAFTTLMIAELGVSVFGFGRTLSAHLEQYRQLPTLLGLVGQIAFAAFPVIQSDTGSRDEAE
jgi:hypothetical protein